MRFRDKEPVYHCNDGRSALKNEVWGLLQDREFLLAIVIALFTSGVPWWWSVLDIKVQLPLKFLLVFLPLLVIALLWYLRLRTKRSLDMKHQLHMISHDIRDQYVKFKAQQGSVDIHLITQQFCQLIQRYFSILVQSRGNDVGVAIRLAEKVVTGEIVYKTYGRACLNNNRQKNSLPLGANEGVAKLLHDEIGRSGIFVYDDMRAAVEEGAYVQHPNDLAYPDDIATMMIAPINGWDGVDKGMLGILYVTARKKGMFGEKYTDSMGFVSDALANIYSDLVMGCPVPENGGNENVAR